VIYKAYSEDDSQPGESLIALGVICELISVPVFGDIGDEFTEISHLEELVECNQLEVKDSFVTDDGRRGAVGKGSVSILFDYLQFAGTWKWQSIRQPVGRLSICVGSISSCRRSDEKWNSAQESNSE